MCKVACNWKILSSCDLRQCAEDKKSYVCSNQLKSYDNLDMNSTMKVRINSFHTKHILPTVLTAIELKIKETNRQIMPQFASINTVPVTGLQKFFLTMMRLFGYTPDTFQAIDGITGDGCCHGARVGGIFWQGKNFRLSWPWYRDMPKN